MIASFAAEDPRHTDIERIVVFEKVFGTRSARYGRAKFRGERHHGVMRVLAA